jgi:hypothetical protein
MAKCARIFAGLGSELGAGGESWPLFNFVTPYPA